MASAPVFIPSAAQYSLNLPHSPPASANPRTFSPAAAPRLAAICRPAAPSPRPAVAFSAEGADFRLSSDRRLRSTRRISGVVAASHDASGGDGHTAMGKKTKANHHHHNHQHRSSHSHGSSQRRSSHGHSQEHAELSLGEAHSTAHTHSHSDASERYSNGHGSPEAHSHSLSHSPSHTQTHPRHHHHRQQQQQQQHHAAPHPGQEVGKLSVGEVGAAAWAAASAAAEEREGSVSEGAARPRWRRVLLKVSGEALAGDGSSNIDAAILASIAREVAHISRRGVQVAVVVGGGNFFRGAKWSGVSGLDRASADHIGMLATVMNGIFLQASLESEGIPTRVQTAFRMSEVAEPYIRRRAVRHLEKGRVVIFAAGTGNPFFTTDTAAALRAAEIDAEVVLKATGVDGVFDSDPRSNSQARLLPLLSHRDVTLQQLKVMDPTAITLCHENKLPVVVFNLTVPGNIVRALSGENVGTLILP
ncbi:hypothetical protein CLOM_g15877 [Closterium sp. NIES-68]|nr:hypothetical protein CLOM_g15877 [Closterium sp. NIES-68]GJP69622.1 hypothetical protein CLOP_g614 [Closterium sp. NIES-67]